MPLGTNLDKIIKKTTPDTNITSNTRIERKKSITNNTNITSRIRNMGLPSQKPESDTYKTKKMTFYIKEELLDKLYNFAYWERKSLTEAFNFVITDGLKGKNVAPKKK